MVLGRRTFTLRDDLRGVLTVLGLGTATFAGLTLVMGLVLAASALVG